MARTRTHETEESRRPRAARFAGRSAAIVLTALFAVAVGAPWVAVADDDGLPTRTDPPPAPPAPPAVFLDTDYVAPTGRTIKVEPSTPGGLQGAIDAARPGDVLLLREGAVYSGNFTLPPKSGSGWVVIRTRVPDSNFPDPGTRVTANHAAKMPKIVTPNSDPAIRALSGAAGYRLLGLEITIGSDVETNGGIVVFGDTTETSLSQFPRDLVVDRCYIHGTPAADVTRGIALNSASTAVIDSYVADCHHSSVDAQALCGWAGPGPFKVVNNRLEGAGENLMFGGGDPRVQGVVPSDIEVRGNYFVKPLAWRVGDPAYAGHSFVVKNLFELKNAQRVLVEGNLFEQNWAAQQNGFSVLITVRNQDGTAPWSVVQDVTFRSNTVRRVAAGINILGQDDQKPSAQGGRYLIADNMFDGIGTFAAAGQGRFLQISNARDVLVDHNTILQSGNLASPYGPPVVRFAFTNNVALQNEYGFIGDGTAPGPGTFARYLPEAIVAHNAIVGGRADLYPAANLFPASLADAGISHPGAPGNGNYRLSAGSLLRGGATDGHDIGCDIQHVRALANAAEGKGDDD